MHAGPAPARAFAAPGCCVHTAAMQLRRLFAALTLTVSLTLSLGAQRVLLPHGAGGLQPAPDAGWVALGETDLAAASRPNDPPAEPARSQLLEVIAALRAQHREGDHVLLYRPSSVANSLVLVNAYSVEGHQKVDDMLADAYVAALRDRLLANYGNTARCTGHARTEVFPTGGLVLQFSLRQGDVDWRIDLYAAPAGRRVQFFEVSHRAADGDAPAQAEALLRTFDGASEDRDDPVLVNMIVAGIAGAVLGSMTALWRRKRQQRAMAESGAANG